MNRSPLPFTAGLVAMAISSLASAQAPPPSSGGDTPPPLQPAALDQAMNSGPRGTLAVRAIQGTRGGPEVTEGEVEIVLFHRNQPIKEIKSALDEHGVLMIGDLPIAMGVRPLVRIRHAGVLYQDAGPQMDARTREATVNVTVYETTDQAPDWRIIARHAAADWREDSLEVGETLVVENPGDRTWLGEPADAEGRRTTVNVWLPPDATEVELGPGFHGWCCTAVNDGRLNIQMPLMPGKMTYQFAYRLPIKEGRCDLRLTSPVKADHLAIFVPDDSSGATPTVLQAGPRDMTGDKPMRVFQGEGVMAQQVAGVVLTRAAATPASVTNAAAPTRAAERGATTTQIGVAAIAALAVLAGIGTVIMKKRGARSAA